MLGQIAGPVRKNMAKVLLGCIVGSKMDKDNPKGVLACKAILDFISLAQYGSHDDVTLGYMDAALKAWEKNRHFFIEARVRADFDIPKFHSLLHYLQCVRDFGTTDNYNTEMFERLHIDFAKKGWRASNKKDAVPQMVKWLQRQEKVAALERLFELSQERKEEEAELEMKRLRFLDLAKRSRETYNNAMEKLALDQDTYIIVAKRTSRQYIQVVEQQYHCPTLASSLNAYLARLQGLSRTNARNYRSPFDTIQLWKQFKLVQNKIQPHEEQHIYTVKATPEQQDTVVVIQDKTAGPTNLRGTLSSYSTSSA
jgi:hypothetical protein